jgi:small subunit ribosomal protein S17
MIGKVTSTKMHKTIVVKVERHWRHPLYKKIIKKSKKYLAHDELGVKVGDKVRIHETKPISKRKRWKIIEKIEKQSKRKSNKKKT